MRFLLLVIISFAPILFYAQNKADDLLKKSNTSYLAAGNLDPHVKIVEYDRLYPFNRGAVIVAKGNVVSIVDSSFKAVVPSEKYQIQINNSKTEGTIPSNTNGLFSVSTRTHEYLINAKGKILFSEDLSSKEHSHKIEQSENQDGMATVVLRTLNKQNPGKFTMGLLHINYNGESVTFERSSVVEWGEGLAKNRIGNKYGYKNIKNQVVIPYQFDDAGVFSNGMAAVAKKDEFGILKWGYINVKGEIVIPYRFSRKPGNFGDGVALVKPLQSEDYKIALINKSGEILLKYPLDHPFSKQYGNDYDLTKEVMFRNGNLFFYAGVMKKDGTVVSYTDFFNSLGLPDTCMASEIKLTSINSSGEIFINSKRNRGIGMFNIDNGAYIPPVFFALSHFDPVTNLAYAKYEIKKDNNGRPVFREGYINRQGVFMIAKSEGEKW
jgi:hypothetical protein